PRLAHLDDASCHPRLSVDRATAWRGVQGPGEVAQGLSTWFSCLVRKSLWDGLLRVTVPAVARTASARQVARVSPGLVAVRAPFSAWISLDPPGAARGVKAATPPAGPSCDAAGGKHERSHRVSRDGPRHRVRVPRRRDRHGGGARRLRSHLEAVGARSDAGARSRIAARARASPNGRGT